MQQELIQINVRVIDGTEVWIPIQAEQVALNKYQVSTSDYFDPNDRTVLFEFIPGDVVTITEKQFQNGSIGKIACKLVTPSHHPDKRYLELLFKVATESLPIEAISGGMYQAEFSKAKSEIEEGVLMYPAIQKVIEKAFSSNNIH